MEFITMVIDFLTVNYIEIVAASLGVIGVAEIITRFTPTKKDDAFLERVGSVFRKIMDYLKIPNLKK